MYCFEPSKFQVLIFIFRIYLLIFLLILLFYLSFSLIKNYMIRENKEPLFSSDVNLRIILTNSIQKFMPNCLPILTDHSGKIYLIKLAEIVFKS